ncbi:MAG: YCF48-related protein [Rhodocyclaceae bacterium]
MPPVRKILQRIALETAWILIPLVVLFFVVGWDFHRAPSDWTTNSYLDDPTASVLSAFSPRVTNAYWRGDRPLDPFKAYFINDKIIIHDGLQPLISSDQGRLWRRIGLPPHYYSWQRYDAQFLSDGQTGWFAFSKQLWWTRDAGSTWSEARVPTGFSVNALHFSADGQTGWTAGSSHIFHTQDGGKTWEKQYGRDDSERDIQLRKIKFQPDAKRGYAVGKGIILITQDGGRQWTAMQAENVTAFAEPNGGRELEFRDIFFSPDGSHLWSSGVNSRDYGKNWQRSPQTLSVANMGFVDAKSGWMLNDDRTLYLTNDGGESWQPASRTRPHNLLAIHAESDLKHFTAVDTNGSVLASDDSGKSWRYVSRGSRGDWRSLHVSPGGKFMWAAGTDGILFSEDGGARWIRQTTGEDLDLRAVKFCGDQTRGWAVGTRGLLETRDAGKHWQALEHLNPEWLSNVFVSEDCQHIWAVRQDGKLMQSHDGGQVWRRETISHSSLNLVQFAADSKSGWIASERNNDNPQLLITNDGGKSWRRSALPVRSQGVVAMSLDAKGKEGLVVSGWAEQPTHEHLLRTRDGGKTWQTPEPSESGCRPDVLTFPANAREGMGIGRVEYSLTGTVTFHSLDKLFLCKTTDGGQSWKVVTQVDEFMFNSHQERADRKWVRDIQFSRDSQYGCYVGSHYQFACTRDGGLSWQTPAYGRDPSLYSYLALAGVVITILGRYVLMSILSIRRRRAKADV